VVEHNGPSREADTSPQIDELAHHVAYHKQSRDHVREHQEIRRNVVALGPAAVLRRLMTDAAPVALAGAAICAVLNRTGVG
jgi:hypothetical protein